MKQQDGQPKDQKNPLKRMEVEDWFKRNILALEANKQMALKDIIKEKSSYTENLKLN